jgi:hypothetical protein
MGQCYSIPLLIPVLPIQDHRNCAICSDPVTSSSSKIYVKCNKCHILLHTLCAFEYKSKTNSSSILCPNCKRKHSLFIYDNNVSGYNCELV